MSEEETAEDAEYSEVEESAPMASAAMDEPAAEPVAPPADGSEAFDPDMIRDMVREVVMEQLAGSDADRLIRDVIKNELTAGEIGANISNNVLRLIQSEAGKALSK